MHCHLSSGRALYDRDNVRSIDGSADARPTRPSAGIAREGHRQPRNASAVSVAAELSCAVLHELKQPLTSILLNAQTAAGLLDGGAPPTDLAELRTIINDIILADRRASVVMERVGSLFRDEPRARERVHASALIDDVLAITHGELVVREVVTECHVDPDTPPMSGDRVQLQQVLVNLIVNACEAMDGRVDERCLTVRAAEGAGGFCHLSVSDTGPGIALRQPSGVFDPFVTSKPNGLGLGLAICRKVVAAHSGKIWVENNDAGGATFHIRLPAFVDQAPARTATDDAAHAARAIEIREKTLAAQATNLRLRDEHRAILARIARDRDARAERREARNVRIPEPAGRSFTLA